MDNANEIIAPIPLDSSHRVPAKGCDGPYEINRLGEIFNAKTGRKLRLQLNRGGYLFFNDWCDGVPKSRTVHRVSATTFVPNPHGYPQVNHINGNKTDNRPENLEWCTSSQNHKHAYDVLGRVGNRKGKPKTESSGKLPRPVRSTHLQTGKVQEFESISEAARKVSGNNAHICAACRGKSRSAYGYLWEYA